jgi:hypothetical protein
MIRKANVAFTLLWIVLFGLSGKSQQASSVSSDGLIIQARPIKQRFVPGEEVSINVTLANKGSRKILIHKNLHFGESIVVDGRGPSGRPVQVCGRIPQSTVNAASFVTLEPNASLSRVVSLSCSAKVITGLKFEEEGTYVLRLGYVLSIPASVAEKVARGAQVIEGPIQSEEIRIQITH